MKLSFPFLTAALLAVVGAMPADTIAARAQDGTTLLARDQGTEDHDSVTEVTEMVKRIDVPIRNTDCGYGDWADRRWVLQATADVRANPWASVAGAPPGGSKCTRLACYKGANIWLCNDRNSFLKVRSYVIGDIVDQMTIDCHHWDGNFYSTRGQVFTTDNWNVIVRGTNNC